MAIKKRRYNYQKRGTYSGSFYNLDFNYKNIKKYIYL